MRGLIVRPQRRRRCGNSARRGLLRRLLAEEEGATAIEYGLIVALVSIGLVTVGATLGDSIEGFFTSTSGKIENVNAGE